MRVKSNKRMKVIAILLVLVMLISVGYAFLSTQLTINGTATVKGNSWKIYFTNIVPTEGSVTPTTAPTTDGTSTTELNWAVSLDTPGQFYEFTVDAVNAGTIEAMIGNLSNSTLTTDQAKYLDYTVTYSDGALIEQYDRLAPNGGVEKLKVRVEFKKDITAEDLPTTAQEITLSYTSNYVQADTNAKTRTKSISGATIKVDGNTVGNENITMQKGTTSVISIENTEGMENVTYSSSDTSVATVDSNGNIVGVNQGTATITLTGETSGAEKTITVQVKKPLEIGDTVNYTTSLNGVTLDNWKVFDIDGDYTYIILDDYLPNSAISDSLKTAHNLCTYDTYNVSTIEITMRADLINAMTTKSNWNQLLRGTINGTAIDYTGTTDTKVYANGSPTLELWIDSWNKVYPDYMLYTAYRNNMSDGYNGNYVGTSPNPTSTYIKLDGKAGYQNPLYYPHTAYWNGTEGYCLASFGANSYEDVMIVYADYSEVTGTRCDDTICAFRPIICLPSSVLE